MSASAASLSFANSSIGSICKFTRATMSRPGPALPGFLCSLMSMTKAKGRRSRTSKCSLPFSSISVSTSATSPVILPAMNASPTSSLSDVIRLSTADVRIESIHRSLAKDGVTWFPARPLFHLGLGQQQVEQQGVARHIDQIQLVSGEVSACGRERRRVAGQGRADQPMTCPTASSRLPACQS